MTRPIANATALAIAIAIVCSVNLTAGSAKAIAASSSPVAPTWAGYLDHAYVYSSARPKALRARLAGYGREVGVTLSDYIAEHYGDKSISHSEDEQRRMAIAYLLDYLAEGDGADIHSALHAVDLLKNRLERHENRYWYHYIRAHQALHLGNAFAFDREIYSLWITVVAELESPFSTYQALSLGASTTTGFVTTLPYLYENIARIILIRSQSLGIDQSLDALTSIVFMLADDRVGSVPEIIPRRHSSVEYLDHIAKRLRGPESDGGSLTFTLALVEAEKAHHEASRLLADEGFSQRTIDATRVAMGAYQKALRHAVTLQGQSAVYVRVLREIGEIYAASQRLGVMPELELPFGVEEAILVYGALNRDHKGDWQRHGFQDHGHETYVQTMHELWREIQEVSLNAAEFELSLADQPGEIKGERINAALGRYAEFLAMFKKYATSDAGEAVPDSAYFGAHLAHRGIGAAVLRFNPDNPTDEQLELAIEQFNQAIDLYPFDRHLWSFIASTLERTGREAEFLQLVKPTAQKVSRSTYVDRWVRGNEPRALEIGAFRNALGNDLAIMYFGFTDDRSLADLQQDLAALVEERSNIEERVATLTGEREVLVSRRSEILRAAPADATELPSVSGAPPLEEIERIDGIDGIDQTAFITGIDCQLRTLADRRDRVDVQLLGRAKALALYEEALAGDGFLEQLASQRDQPVHALVRRLFYEDESESRFGDRVFIRSVPDKLWDGSSNKARRPAYDRRQP